jgi:hypothetical protein
VARDGREVAPAVDLLNNRKLLSRVCRKILRRFRLEPQSFCSIRIEFEKEHASALQQKSALALLQ